MRNQICLKKKKNGTPVAMNGASLQGHPHLKKKQKKIGLQVFPISTQQNRLGCKIYISCFVGK
jgi:hypothetical protein